LLTVFVTAVFSAFFFESCDSTFLVSVSSPSQTTSVTAAERKTYINKKGKQEIRFCGTFQN